MADVEWVNASDVPAEWEGKPVWHWCDGWRKWPWPARPALEAWSAERFAWDGRTDDVWFALADVPEPPAHARRAGED